METLKRKVTTEALRKMKTGQTVVFDLASFSEMNTGKSLAYRVQHELGCKFKAMSDYANNRLILTKLAKTV